MSGPSCKIFPLCTVLKKIRKKDNKQVSGPVLCASGRQTLINRMELNVSAARVVNVLRCTLGIRPHLVNLD